MIGAIAGLWRRVKSMIGGNAARARRPERRGVVEIVYEPSRDEEEKFGSGKVRRFRLMSGLYRFRARYDGRHAGYHLP